MSYYAYKSPDPKDSNIQPLWVLISCQRWLLGHDLVNIVCCIHFNFNKDMFHFISVLQYGTRFKMQYGVEN